MNDVSGPDHDIRHVVLQRRKRQGDVELDVADEPDATGRREEDVFGFKDTGFMCVLGAEATFT